MQEWPSARGLLARGSPKAWPRAMGLRESGVLDSRLCSPGPRQAPHPPRPGALLAMAKAGWPRGPTAWS